MTLESRLQRCLDPSHWYRVHRDTDVGAQNDHEEKDVPAETCLARFSLM